MSNGCAIARRKRRRSKPVCNRIKPTNVVPLRKQGEVTTRKPDDALPELRRWTINPDVEVTDFCEDFIEIYKPPIEGAGVDQQTIYLNRSEAVRFARCVLRACGFEIVRIAAGVEKNPFMDRDLKDGDMPETVAESYDRHVAEMNELLNGKKG